MRSERDGDHLDAAIDAAARSLTAGEPSAALRASVRERVGEASDFRRKAGRWLVPAGAMAALIAVMFVGRTLSGPAPSGGPDKARPTDVRVTIDSTSTQRVGLTGGLDQTQPTGASVPMRHAAETFDLPLLQEPEPAIPPLVIAPLETELIAVDDSGVMSIEIEPLQIEPLRGD